jgi:hypothetical protein
MHLNLPVSFKQLVQILLFTILLIMQKKNMVTCLKYILMWSVYMFLSIYIFTLKIKVWWKFDRKYYFNLTILVTISDQIEVEK